MEKSVWTQSISDLSLCFQVNLHRGLDEIEASKRLEKEGPNTLPKKRKIVWWKLLLRQFHSFMIWLLIFAAIVAGMIGEGIDAFAIVAIVLFNGGLGFFQEFRAEKSMEALQKLASPLSKVIREGGLKELPSEKIVPGDLIVLDAGDLIPADGRIVSFSSLSVDEALLTGESLPIAKTDQLLDEQLTIGDRKNMVFRGTTVVRGKGTILVTNTGLQTEMGKIASELLEEKKEQTPLQKQLDRVGKKLVYLCIGIVFIVFLLGLLRGNSLIEMALTALSLAVAAIPEGLPAAVTIALSIGVKKMAEKKALIRRLSSVETLGSTNVICTDKTGTLTQNAMTVRALWVDREFVEVTGNGYPPEGEFSKNPPDLEMALSIGLLCNNAHLLQEEGNWKVIGDPTEGALITAAGKKGLDKRGLEEKFPFIEEIPFDAERKMMSVLRKTGETKKLFVKGAVDKLLLHSQKWLHNGKEEPLTENQKQEIEQANATLASKAYRVLAVAYQTNLSAPLEEDLVFVGLVAMIDPPRLEVKEALEECYHAGIKTVMVTGDHKETALAIGKELGMDVRKAVNGEELATLSEKELKEVSIFSRINASDKLRIIEAYQKEGLVTAMTGDGVNDAPAVHRADIGISMGITGTDVTKESSDMVILDDNFATIVKAVEQGRGIYDNIVKFISYLLSSNIAEILVIFLAILLNFQAEGRSFVPLLPVQLLWINLITDGFPAISLALDPVDPLAMKKKPRPRKEPILNRRFSLFIFSISFLVTIGALTSCFYGMKTSSSLAQTMTFTTLIVLELIRVQMIRKQYRMTLFSNPYLLWALGSSFALQLLVLYFPPFQLVFNTVPLGWLDWGVIAGVAFVLWWVGLFVTRLFYKSGG